MRSARESSRPPRPRTARHGRPVAFQRRERFLSRAFSVLRLCNARSASGTCSLSPSPPLTCPHPLSASTRQTDTRTLSKMFK